MKLRQLFRSRLAVRIYLTGLAQFAVVAIAFFVLLSANRPPGGGPLRGQARFMAAQFHRDLNDSQRLAEDFAQIQDSFPAQITLLAPDGTVVGSSSGAHGEQCPKSNPSFFAEEHGEVCLTEAVPFPDGRRGTLIYRAPRRPPPFGFRTLLLILLVVGVSSWLLTRSLTRPLRRLSATARAFGSGDLFARAALPQRDELGDVARAFDEMATRVTELLRAEKELLANISHELRTPLARIRVALDIAAEGDAEVARESLLDITSDLAELERLITDVLTTARLDLAKGPMSAGIPPLKRQPLNPRELLAQAAARFRAAHSERSLQVVAEEPLPLVYGDSMLLRRVIDNLLENAHSYTEDPSAALVLKGTCNHRVVLLEVIDKGVGISATDLPQVFRPFFRADRSRTRATGGLGLGLALAKRIVEAHGGTIELTSLPQVGTCARVQLPIVDT
jgi:two-component system, OmpR family, sensor kinase